MLLRYLIPDETGIARDLLEGLLEPDKSRRMKMSDVRDSEYFQFGPMGPRHQEREERQQVTVG